MSVFSDFLRTITGEAKRDLEVAKHDLEAELSVVKRDLDALRTQFAADKSKLAVVVKASADDARAKLTELVKDAEPAIKTAVDSEVSVLAAKILAALA